MLDMLFVHCKRRVLQRGITEGDEVWQLGYVSVAGQILFANGRSLQAM